MKKTPILDFFYLCVLRPICWAIFTLPYKVEIIGRENIPASGNFIVAANHRSYLDPPFIAWVLSPKITHWIVARRIYLKWYFKPFCIISRSVPVGGSTPIAEGVLNQGGIIGIFPEGGICCDRVIKKGHKGVAVLALSTGVPVLPCYIDGTFDTRKKTVLAPRIFRPLKLVMGKPLRFEKVPLKRMPGSVIEKTLPQIINAINVLKPANGKR